MGGTALSPIADRAPAMRFADTNLSCTPHGARAVAKWHALNMQQSTPTLQHHTGGALCGSVTESRAPEMTAASVSHTFGKISGALLSVTDPHLARVVRAGVWECPAAYSAMSCGARAGADRYMLFHSRARPIHAFCVFGSFFGVVEGSLSILR